MDAAMDAPRLRVVLADSALVDAGRIPRTIRDARNVFQCASREPKECRQPVDSPAMNFPNSRMISAWVVKASPMRSASICCRKKVGSGKKYIVRSNELRLMRR